MLPAQNHVPDGGIGNLIALPLRGQALREGNQEDVQGSMEIMLSNLLYVDTENLKYRLQNQIRRLAAFLNPVYFKNQRIGYSNYQESRTIYMGQDEHGYIGIPRGLYDELMQRCRL